MNWDQIQGEWTEFRGKIRERWGKLSDDEVDRAKGSQEQLVGVIQQRYGVAKDEAKEQVSAFMEDANGYLAQMKEKVSEKAHDVKDYVQNTDYTEMASDLKQLIGRYPVQSMLIGLGLGFVIGRGLSSGSSR